MDNIRNWFTALSRREQILLGTAGALLLISIIVFGVVRPLWLGSFAAKESYTQQAYAAAQLDARFSVLQSAPAPVEAPSGSLIEILTSDAAPRGIILSSTNPSAQGGAAVTVSAINPNSFFEWALALEEKGIILAKLTMQPVAAQGNEKIDLVSAQAEFSRLSGD